MIKDNCIKLMAIIAIKIILQKKMVKYQDIIEDIDEYLDENLQSTKNIKDFENIFNKLKTEYKSKLVDTDESNDEEDDDKMELVNNKDNNNNK